MSHRPRLFSSPQEALVTVLFCMTVCILIPGVCAADEYYTGYLGDVIDLHGYSYGGGDQIYLFMTGPGLPANGVTLTDVSQRADQGEFTVVPLDRNQHWSMKWDTSRIWNEIDPGTYTVYITTQAVDKSHLGGSNSYQTLSVYLKDAGSIAVADRTSYSLNLNDEGSTMTVTTAPVQSPLTVTPTATFTPPMETTTLIPVVFTSAVPTTTTKTAVQPITVIIAVLGAGLLIYRMTSR